MLNRRAREQALQQLGVVQWYSRKVLPGALGSPVLELEELVDQPVTTTENNNVDASVNAESAAQTVLSTLKLGEHHIDSMALEAKPSEDEQARRSVLDQVAAQGEESPKVSAVKTRDFSQSVTKNVSYRLFKCSEIMVLTESAVDSPASNEGKLLDNILRACGLSVNPAQLLGAFNWPVFTAKTMPVDDATLESLMKRWLNENQVNVAPVVFKLGVSFTEFDGVFADSRAKTIQLDSSLMALLSMPAKKSAFWRSLQSSLPVLKEYAGT